MKEVLAKLGNNPATFMAIGGAAGSVIPGVGSAAGALIGVGVYLAIKYGPKVYQGLKKFGKAVKKKFALAKLKYGLKKTLQQLNLNLTKAECKQLAKALAKEMYLLNLPANAEQLQAMLQAQANGVEAYDALAQEMLDDDDSEEASSEDLSESYDSYNLFSESLESSGELSSSLSENLNDSKGKEEEDDSTDLNI